MWHRADLARFLAWLDEQGLINSPIEIEIDEVLDLYENDTGVFTPRSSDV
jgi:hypothetical protein